jgi:hypothetical protein
MSLVSSARSYLASKIGHRLAAAWVRVRAAFGDGQCVSVHETSVSPSLSLSSISIHLAGVAGVAGVAGAAGVAGQSISANWPRLEVALRIHWRWRGVLWLEAELADASWAAVFHMAPQPVVARLGLVPLPLPLLRPPELAPIVVPRVAARVRHLVAPARPLPLPRRRPTVSVAISRPRALVGELIASSLYLPEAVLAPRRHVWVPPATARFGRA